MLTSSSVLAEEYSNFYFSSAVGSSKTNLSNSELKNALASVPVNDFSLERKSTSYQVNLGYQYSQNWGIELGYLDLGKREITVDLGNMELESFFLAMEDHLADTGIGYTASVNYSYSIYPDLSAYAKIGGFSWHNDISLSDGKGKKLTLNEQSTSLFYGVGLTYHLSPNLSIFSGVEQVELERHSVTNVGFGVKWRFQSKPIFNFIKGLSASNDTREANVRVVEQVKKVNVTDLLVTSSAKTLKQKITKEAVKTSNFECNFANLDNFLPLYPTWQNDRITLPVYFAHNGFTLSKQQEVLVDKIAKCLQKNENYLVELTGVTSSRGTASYNFKLAQRRSHEVAKWLANGGIVNDKIVINEPLQGDAEANSRRVDIQLKRLPYRKTTQVYQYKFKSYSTWFSPNSQRELINTLVTLIDSAQSYYLINSFARPVKSYRGAIALANDRAVEVKKALLSAYPNITVKLSFQVLNNHDDALSDKVFVTHVL